MMRFRILPLLLIPCAAYAQEVRGRVVQNGSLEPLPNVSVRLLDSAGKDLKSVATTDSKGMFWMAAAMSGKYKLHISRIGYAPQVTPVFTLSAASPINMTMELFPNPQMLPELTIIADSEKVKSPLYYHRRLLGMGRVTTEQQIKDRNLLTVMDILRQTPGVTIEQFGPYSLVKLPPARLRPPRQGTPQLIASANQGNGEAQFILANNCPVNWYLNRTLISTISDADPTKSLVFQMMEASSVKAVEVFLRQTDVPAEFSDRTGYCGAIVVWTRRPD